MTNPFNPTFGDVPKIYFDTENKVKKLVQTIQQSEFARSFFITGVRGSGKTSFMTQVEHLLQQDERCICIDLINDESLLTSFIQQLSAASQTTTQRLFKKVGLSSVNIGQVGVEFNFSANQGNQTANVARELMIKIQEHKRYVVVAIDEIDNSKLVRSFAQVFNELKRQGLPIIVLMTGLPDLVLDIQNDKKLTFLLRSEKINMAPLQQGNMLLAYKQTFNTTTAIASKMVRLVQGYSYAFQLLGYLAYNQWDQSQSFGLLTLKEIVLEYQLELFDNAYQKIFMDLSQVDKQYLVAVRNGQSLSKVAQLMGVTPQYTAQYRRRALARHLIVPAGRGIVRYTLPLFDKFLDATQSPDSIYYDEV